MPGNWGWSGGGGYPSAINTRLWLSDGPECVHRWSIDELFKLATELGVAQIKAQGYESKESFIQKKLYLLKAYP